LHDHLETADQLSFRHPPGVSVDLGGRRSPGESDRSRRRAGRTWRSCQ
jgi:hypothetical protein